jgi:SnoaL-like domain
MDEIYHRKVTELINKSEITSAVSTYFRALDEKLFDTEHFATIFTAEAKITRPNGTSLTGPKEISASHQQSFTRFEGTQHLLAAPDISIDESTATVRVNLVAMHMWQGSNTIANKADNFFIAGGIVDAKLVRDNGQWKISQLSNTVVWRAGGFKDMAQTGKPAS